MLVVSSVGHAAVEYVKVCSLYGAGFHYYPGTDVCINEGSSDARQQTEAGTWRSLLPYPEGKWAAIPRLECGFGRLVPLDSAATGHPFSTAARCRSNR